jgi:hypothetical protein
MKYRFVILAEVGEFLLRASHSALTWKYLYISAYSGYWLPWQHRTGWYDLSRLTVCGVDGAGPNGLLL